MNTHDAYQYLIGRMLVFVLANLVSITLVNRLFGLQFKKGQILPTLKETMPFGLSHGLAVIYERADITIIAYGLGKAAAGLYAPAITLMTTLFLIPLAIYEVMLPVLSKMYAENPHLVCRTGFRLFSLSAGMGALLGIGMTIIAYPLVWLFYGQDYLVSGSVLMVLSGVLVFKCASFALAAILAAVGWQHKRILVQLMAAIFNVVVNILIVRSYGIMGVAYIYVLTEFLLLIGYTFMQLRWQTNGCLQPVRSYPS